IDTLGLFESSLATARSCLPSLLKSPTATKKGIPAGDKSTVVKLTGVHVTGVVTVKVKVLLTLAPPTPKAFTVTKYAPAGCASVTCTSPVAGSPSRVPLKLVEVETVILVVLVGVASGVTVVSALSGIDVSP